MYNCTIILIISFVYGPIIVKIINVLHRICILFYCYNINNMSLINYYENYIINCYTYI